MHVPHDYYARRAHMWTANSVPTYMGRFCRQGDLWPSQAKPTGAPGVAWCFA